MNNQGPAIRDIILFRGFPEKENRRQPGVYMFGRTGHTIYIGASNHVRRRAKNHVSRILCGYESSDEKLTAYVKQCIADGVMIEVSLLHPDPMKEEYYYRRYFGPPPPLTRFYHQTHKPVKRRKQ